MPTQPVLITVEQTQVGSRSVPTVSLFDIHAYVGPRQSFYSWRDRALRLTVLVRDLDFADGGIVQGACETSQDLRLTVPAARQLLAALGGIRAKQLNHDLVTWEQAVAAENFGSTETLPAIARVTLAGVSVRQDAEGRFCLNDCHKASGGEKKNGPAYWLETDQARALAAELTDTGNPVSPVSSIRGGSSQGTYVARELVYAYAMWISPAFHLTVIRAFDALVHNQVPTPAIDLAGIRSLIADALAEHNAALPDLVEAAIGQDRRVAVREFKAPIQVLREMNVPQRGRRPLSRRVSHRLFKFAIATGRGALIRESAETGRNLFQVDVIKDWLAHEGNSLIADHKARVMGQTVIPFGPKPL